MAWCMRGNRAFRRDVVRRLLVTLGVRRNYFGGFRIDGLIRRFTFLGSSGLLIGMLGGNFPSIRIATGPR